MILLANVTHFRFAELQIERTNIAVKMEQERSLMLIAFGIIVDVDTRIKNTAFIFIFFKLYIICNLFPTFYYCQNTKFKSRIKLLIIVRYKFINFDFVF